MTFISENIYKNPSIDSMPDIIKTVSKQHNEEYGYHDVYKPTVISNIQFVDQTNKKTMNITVNGYHLKHSARKTIMASKGRFRMNKTTKVSIILESEVKKHVINTYLKTKIPTMWRKFFENIAKNRDYIYNYCNNPYRKFHRHCVYW